MKERYSPHNMYIFQKNDNFFVGYYKGSQSVEDVFTNRRYTFLQVSVVGPLVDYLRNDKSISEKRLPFVTKREILRVLNAEEKAMKYAKKLEIKYNYRPKAIVFAEKAI